jgi:hypothetical protein
MCSGDGSAAGLVNSGASLPSTLNVKQCGPAFSTQ